MILLTTFHVPCESLLPPWASVSWLWKMREHWSRWLRGALPDLMFQVDETGCPQQESGSWAVLTSPIMPKDQTRGDHQ